MSFGDGSSTKYVRKGKILVHYTNGKVMELPNVLNIPVLKTNILSLGKLKDQGSKTTLEGGFLTIHDKLGRLLTKTQKAG